MSERIDLNNFKVITDKLNTYFKNNQFMVGSSIPNVGTYKVGDIIVNNGNNATEIPMWICTEAGTPGTWEVFNSGGMEETELENYITNIVQSQAVSAVDYTDGMDIQIDGKDYSSDIGQLNDLQTINKDNLVGAINEVNQKASGEVDLSLYQQKTDNNLQTSSKDVIGAINELFQNANNGKELIANAIGEPLNSEDTFSAMSNDINSLLSTFKSNMMKNGVTVESNDRFKSLIDKIATMVEEGEGKGIQFATGQGTPTSIRPFIDVIGGSLNLYYLQVNNLTFKPSIILLGYSDPTYGDYTTFYSEELASDRVTLVNTKRDNITLGTLDNVVKSSSCTINSTGFILPVSMARNYTWIAIGVGEEDTTLRDSLASILQGEGVEVSPDDDMADLIGKVDSIKSGGSLDIISATELPTAGRENQICVITENPVDKYLLSGNYNDKTTDDTIFIYTNSSSEESVLYETGKSIVTRYYLSSIYQGDVTLSSYTYNNGVWNKLTSNSLVLLSGSYYNTDVFGKATLGASSLTTNGWTITGTSLFAAGLISTNVIDFSKYKSVKIRGYVTSNITSPLDIYVGSNTLTSSYVDNAWSGMMMPFGSTQQEAYYFTNFSKFTIPTGAIVPNVEFETDIDISSITGGYRFRLGVSSRSSNFASNGGNIVVTSLELLL